MVVIFGISSGIGKEIAKSISKVEKVFGTYNSTNNLEDLDMNNIILEKVNLMNIDEIKKYVGQFKNSKERITVLNAAVLNTDSIINNAKIEDLDSSFSLNIKSNFVIAQEFAPIMMDNKFGRFIYFSSIVARHGAIGASIYGLSKASLLGLSRSIALEYGRFGITSNVLELGYFDLGLGFKLKDDQTSNILKEIPSHKFGTSENVIEAILFCQKSDYLNGSVITIDGGIQLV